jgi:hypothetical protein
VSALFDDFIALNKQLSSNATLLADPGVGIIKFASSKAS